MHHRQLDHSCTKEHDDLSVAQTLPNNTGCTDMVYYALLHITHNLLSGETIVEL